MTLNFNPLTLVPGDRGLAIRKSAMREEGASTEETHVEAIPLFIKQLGSATDAINTHFPE